MLRIGTIHNARTGGAGQALYIIAPLPTIHLSSPSVPRKASGLRGAALLRGRRAGLSAPSSYLSSLYARVGG